MPGALFLLYGSNLSGGKTLWRQSHINMETLEIKTSRKALWDCSHLKKITS